MTETSLIDTISSDISTALRAREQNVLDTLRMLKAALTNKRVDLMRDLEPGEALQVVTTLVKQRKESVIQFSAAGRDELARKEEREIAILERYLPTAIGESDLVTLIDGAIAETGASEPKDMGKVMKALMPRLTGQVVDGRLVNERVKSRLASMQG